MIKLAQKKHSYWHPDGDAEGKPLKIDVDQFMVTLVRVDYISKTLEVCGMYGHTESGEFVPYTNADGSIGVFSKVIARDDLKGAKFTEFLTGTSAKGAPLGEFRRSDVEGLLLAEGHVDGVIE